MDARQVDQERTPDQTQVTGRAFSSRQPRTLSKLQKALLGAGLGMMVILLGFYTHQSRGQKDLVLPEDKDKPLPSSKDVRLQEAASEMPALEASTLAEQAQALDQPAASEPPLTMPPLQNTPARSEAPPARHFISKRMAMADGKADVGMEQEGGTSPAPVEAKAPAEARTMPTDRTESPVSPSGGGSGDSNRDFMGQVSGQSMPIVKAQQFNNLCKVVFEGKMLDAALETPITSDLPGTLRAILTEPLYSECGTVIAPAGSVLFGQNNTAVRRGQDRLYVVWNRLRTMKGTVFQLDSPGGDPLGRAGIPADVDNHYWQIFGMSAMLSIIGTGASANSTAQGAKQDYRTAVQQSFANQAKAAMEPAAEIAPTLQRAQGARIKVILINTLMVP